VWKFKRLSLDGAIEEYKSHLQRKRTDPANIEKQDAPVKRIGTGTEKKEGYGNKRSAGKLKLFD